MPLTVYLFIYQKQLIHISSLFRFIFHSLFQFGAELRIVLKPLMIKLPIIGGIQIFFLNTPDITFELEGISGIPGFR